MKNLDAEQGKAEAFSLYFPSSMLFLVTLTAPLILRGKGGQDMIFKGNLKSGPTAYPIAAGLD